MIRIPTPSSKGNGIRLVAVFIPSPGWERVRVRGIE
jgi:hypothetical protein